MPSLKTPPTSKEEAYEQLPSLSNRGTLSFEGSECSIIDIRRRSVRIIWIEEYVSTACLEELSREEREKRKSG